MHARTHNAASVPPVPFPPPAPALHCHHHLPSSMQATYALAQHHAAAGTGQGQLTWNIRHGTAGHEAHVPQQGKEPTYPAAGAACAGPHYSASASPADSRQASPSCNTPSLHEGRLRQSPHCTSLACTAHSSFVLKHKSAPFLTNPCHLHSSHVRKHSLTRVACKHVHNLRLSSLHSPAWKRLRN